MTLAMHMANELLTVPVAGITLALAGVLVALAAVRARKTLDPERLPLMGVMGAFVFAGQMINFTLPLMPGTSGHLGGGVLLAIVLGPAAGIVTMAGILIVQCLLFQDGGLLALGCNIINMGVVPCMLGWGLYRLILGRGGAGTAPWRQYAAAWAACVVGVTAGAALVPVEAAVSGVLLVSPLHFFGVMVGVHLIIGFIEGLITFAVVAYLRQVRPAAVGLARPDTRRALGRGTVIASLLVTSMLLAGIIAWFASDYDDGLEWSLFGHAYGDTDEALAEPSDDVAAVSALQSRWSPMTDYSRRAVPLGETPGEEESAVAEETHSPVDPWKSLAGILGTVVTLGLVYLVSVLLRKRHLQLTTRN